MSYYTFNLIANKPTLVPVAGSVILVDDLGGAPGVDIMPSYGGRDLPTMPSRKKAFKFSEPFDAVTLTAPVNCTVALFLSKNDVDLGFADGSLVNVSGAVQITNAVGAPVPVQVAAGSNVQVTATNVGINNADAQPVPVKVPAGGVLPTKDYKAQAITDVAPVNVGAAAVALIAADPTRRGLRLRNVGANAVALIGAAGSFANAAVILNPGETWNEPEAPGAAWYGVCNAGLASTINIQAIA